jgi:hypothetical protein
MNQIAMYAAAALLVLSAFLYWQLTRAWKAADEAKSAKDKAEAKVMVLEAANQASKDAFGQLLGLSATVKVALDDAKKKIDEADARLRRRLMEIQNAPESDNGPIPPLLQYELDELRYRADGGREGAPSPAPVE